MYSAAVVSVLCFVILTWFHILKSLNSRRTGSASGKLPPGPRPFPIIGNFLHLGQKPHESLAKLSKTYGPLMHLKLGTIDTIVVSSPEMAKEILHKHDKACSGRAVPVSAQTLDHHKMSIAWLPAGKKWRVLRKISKEHMFSISRLDSSQGLRQEKLRELLDYVHECCLSRRVMDIGEAVYVTSLNLMSATLFSVDFTGFDSGSAQEFKETITGVAKSAAAPNIADYVPWLKMIDPQGIRRQSKFYFSKLFGIIESVIARRLQARGTHFGSPVEKDLLEALLDISQGSDYDFSSSEIKHLLLDFFAAGVETTTVTVEWAMTELLRNPRVLSKAKNELRNVVGENKQVKESDISSLSYLQAVIKETLRCHPSARFLVPHKAETDVEINGYMIPKDAQILVNVWAICKDPNVWSRPDSFEPERFLDHQKDYKGRDFELIPFGSGRRMCPGMPLAHRIVHLMVASLIHIYDWKFEGGMKVEEVDISDKFELSLRKAVPLKAIPTRNEA
ncbi:ferruginol synthase-like [Sesamum indicum]|uniref:Ferruginol synthase-like n=1 Tax=Sesamum indicum TaxID=4182 RepID=A0A6I9SJF9_SESIN|nr:ferruginol synthase-like [Sesamum indicum]